MRQLHESARAMGSGLAGPANGSNCRSATSPASDHGFESSERKAEFVRGLMPLAARMNAVALRMTRNAAAAEDVVQNAFEKAIRAQSQFRGEARLSTWIHRIVVNEALMWLRTERRHAPGEPLNGVQERSRDPGPSALDQLLRREIRHGVRREIECLQPEERHVLLHCALEDRSYAEYGRRAGLHPAAAKSRAFRARRRLRKALGPG